MPKKHWHTLVCAVCILSTAALGLAGGVLAYIGMRSLEKYLERTSL